jgi:shikimate dehydrogenase
MKAAVLGSPVAHSLSPALHRAAYRALGLDTWCYEAIECDEARLPGLMDECGPDWAGLSLTMPLKRAVLGLLDHTEPLALDVGAANTVIFRSAGGPGDGGHDGGQHGGGQHGGGRHGGGQHGGGQHSGGRHGYNTDVPGMISALTEAGLPGPESGSPPARVLILGGGATACSALAAARGLGAYQVTVAVRDKQRTGGVLAAASRLGMTVDLTSFDTPWEAAPELLISTAPAGAADIHAERIRDGALIPRYVLDVVYHPWPTRLAVAAQKSGASVAGGFALLLHQAAEQVTLMTGRPAPVEVMRMAGLSALEG